MRYTLLGAACLLGAGFSTLRAEDVAASATLPNIVLIFADDLGYGDVGCYGATKVQTPHIDQLAADGRLFTDGHSASAVCTPSRYALLTGQYPLRANGGRGTWGPLNWEMGLLIPTNTFTIADLLQAKGYATSYFGKWHLGWGTEKKNDWSMPLDAGPNQLGFDYYWGVPRVNCNPPYVYVENDMIVGYDPDDPLELLQEGDTPTPIRMFPPEASHKSGNRFKGAVKAHELYDDEMIGIRLTEKAVEWIGENKEKPFFVLFSTTQIHHPFTPAPRFKGTSDCGLYGDFIHELDWMVGELVKCLEDHGLSENTLVIFTSDNGGMWNRGGRDAVEAGHKINGELLGAKSGAWEGGHRVPFIAKWPAKIPAGTVSDQLVCSLDMMATFAAMTGQEVDPRDSVNLLPALEGDPEKPVRNELVLAALKSTHLSLRQGRWMYIPAQDSGGFGGANMGGHNIGGAFGATFAGSVNSDIVDGKIRKDAPPAQLYDLEADVSQTQNLYHEYPERVEQMSIRLKALRASAHRKVQASERREVAAKIPATPSNRSASFDFESGDLQGWQIYVGEFGKKLVSDKPVFWNTGEPYNKQGTYHLSTLEVDGTRGSDAFTGVIVSPVFRLQAPSLSFLVGGGNHVDTYVALYSEDGLVYRASGANSETMRSVTWEAPELVGKEVFLVIVDESTGGWGHITFDAFQAEGKITEARHGRYNAFAGKERVRQAKLLAEREALLEKKRAAMSSGQFFLKEYPSLIGYWPFDGDLIDYVGEATAEGPADLQFTKGAAGGQALRLTPGLSVGIPEPERNLHGAEALGLFFKLNALPGEAYDPVIISWASTEVEHFNIGVKHDLSGLIYHQGWGRHHVTHIELPHGKPVELGRWYHLTLTSETYDLRVYVDGYECTLTGGALHISRREQEKVVPITFGAVAKKEARAAVIDIDDVAYYGAGLTSDEIQDQLKKGGWGKRLKKAGREVEEYQAKLARAREEKQQEMLNAPSLKARGESEVYENEYLDAISFVVGGIGAGGILFNGAAEPAVWQLACNHDQTEISDSFLAIRAQSQGGQPVVRALQTKPVGPFAAMPSLRFVGEYPFATYTFDEPALPVEVELEVFNPFTPMDARSSGIPCVISTIKATNKSSAPVRVDILSAQKNIVGYTTGAPACKPAYGENQNRLLREGGATLLHMTKGGDGQGAGMDMVLMTQAQGATGLALWESQDSLHGGFAASGGLSGAETADSSPTGQTLNGALSAPLELAPGESKSVTYALTWHMPKAEHGQKETWTHSGNMYENWWPNAMAVADHLRENLDDLTARTRRFHQAMYASNLPVWLLDRMTSQLAVLRSQTCWWTRDGYFGVYEGVGGSQGCCAGNCAHVWHYAQAHARLFPELGRRMREQDFDNQAWDGRIPFRHSHPKSSAADGQFGTLLNTYREHLCSENNTWMKQHWPQIELAMNWAIEEWDPDRDGYLQNLQGNTLDGGMYGCSSWLGSMYLTTLEAVARMAVINGNQSLAESLRTIRASGRKLQNERLWDGDYYIQLPGKERHDDYFDGCHIDQILGEWWGEQITVDRNYPRDRSRTAMQSLLKHNFFANFHGQSLRPRQFVTADDAGMKMITWPKSPRPIPCMDYGDEVMTGFEYAAGVSMIQNDLMREGLMVIKATHDRYDGRLRTEGISTLGVQGYTGNPYGDDECGKFYGRALSVWSALLAMQGFEYDGPTGRIGFRPRWRPENHASFFTTAEGYGLFTQVQDGTTLHATIDLREGRLRLSEVVLACAEGKPPKSVDVKLAGNKVESMYSLMDGELRVRFKNPLVLKAGQKLEAQVEGI